MRLLLTTIVFLLVTCCTFPKFKGDNYVDAPKPHQNDKLATAFIYRVGEGVKIGQVEIYVDGAKLFNVLDKGFTWFVIEPGPHEFLAKWPWDQKPMFEDDHFSPKTLSLNMEAGKTYYVNYQILEDNKPVTDPESLTLIGKAMSKTHVLSVGLIRENKVMALPKLRLCGYQQNNFN